MTSFTLDQELFFSILNNKIFGNDKEDLLEKISKSPERYIGLFRPSKPKTKVFQNLLQSHEIKFGDALELYFEKLLEKKGYILLEKNNIIYNDDKLNIDQLFVNPTNNTLYFVEQKVRDDHDSTKKRGQMLNFEKKLNAIVEKYGKVYSRIEGVVFFIDPSLQKNRKFYEEEINNFQNIYTTKVDLYYGEGFFNDFFGNNTWSELLFNLKERKKTLLDFPIVDYDENSDDSFEIIKKMDFIIMRKVITNIDLREEGIIYALFKNGKVFEMVYNFYNMHSEIKYQNLAKELKLRIFTFYKK